MAAVRIRWHEGARTALRPLFELAEDSAERLDRSIDHGRVLVAYAEDGTDGPVGHLQLVSTDHHDIAEIKNIAVLPGHARQGIGRALVERAIDVCRAEGCSRLDVSTAAADIGNLRFYQRLGFRLTWIEHDAFTEADGYPAGLEIDGIELRDAVHLGLPLEPRTEANAVGEPLAVRPATAADADEIVRMALLLWPDADADDLAELERIGAGDEPRAEIAVVARTGGGLCAFIWLAERPWAEGCPGGPVGYVEGWFTDADLRRHGVGGAMMAYADDWCRGRGYTHLGSDVLLENLVSIAAHRALGFTEVERALLLARPVGPG